MTVTTKVQRTNLAKRLSLPHITEATPVWDRTFLAGPCPAPGTPVTLPIPCAAAGLPSGALGALEALILAACPAVTEAAVTVRTNATGSTLLAVVRTAEQSVTATKVLEWIAGKMEGHLQPDGVVVVAGEVPRGADGAVDVIAARRQDRTRTQTGGGGARVVVVEVESELVSSVKQVWAEALGVDREELTEDSEFFALGGTSLLAGRVASRLRAVLNTPFSVTDLFAARTIAGVVSRVSEASKPKENNNTNNTSDNIDTVTKPTDPCAGLLKQAAPKCVDPSSVRVRIFLLHHCTLVTPS
jgi:acyl carrier protein